MKNKQEKKNEITILGYYTPSKHEASRIIDGGGLCPTIKENHGTVNAVMVDQKYYLSTSMKKYINSKNDKYKVGGGNLIVNRSISCTKTTREGNGRADSSDYVCKELMENQNVENKDLTQYRIRKLTPKECYRLMGFCKRQPDGSFDDSDYDNARQVNSESQIYKQAGNSIVVDVLEAIFKEML